MSLQVWLPLNGDLHNQGLKNICPAGNGVTLDSNGKIGSCYSFNGSNSISINQVVLPSQTPNWSFACWFLLTNTSSTSATCLFSERVNTTATGYTIFIYPKTGKILVDDGARWEVTPMTFSQNIWYHLVITRSPSEKKLYINGQLKNSTFTVGDTTAINMNGCLIGLAQSSANLLSGNQGFVGKLNDIRIYDHCLSAKEVEEISKGLILHYKLDNDGFGNENYWGNGKPLRENASSGELRITYARQNSSYASVPTFIPNEYIETKFLSTRTQVDNGLIQFQKLQRYTTTNSSMCPILEHLKTGEHFTISYELYITSPIKVRFALTKILDGTSTKVQPNIDPIQISTLNNWTKVSQSVEIPSSFDESNITTESLLGMYIGFYDILGTTSAGEVTIRVRNIKFEKGQVATDWTPARADFGHSSDDIIYDSSGYNNNGTIIGSLEAIISSPRYDCATHFSGSPNCINAGRGAMGRDAITVSCWGYMDNWSNYNTRLLSCTEGGGWNFEPSSGKMQFAISTGASGSTYKNAASTIALASLSAGWHLFTGTYDGFTTKIYIDGELQGTNNAYTTKTLIFYHSSNSAFIGAEAGSSATTPAGNYFVGNISDVRVYATALTAEQIKELYDTSTSIDKNGNIYARELVEI